MVQTSEKIHLNPTLVPFGSSSDLHLQPGNYLCQIHASKGNLVFQHLTYDIYNGTWDALSSEKTFGSVRIHEGETKKISFSCQTHDGCSDEICIVNDSFFKPAEFTCICTQQ